MEKEKQAIEVTSGCKVFGAYKALCGIEGIVPVIHGAMGCFGNNTFFQMAQDESLLKGACCALQERDVIFGSEKKLVKTLETVKEHYQPEVIAILGCCVPALIGDDIEAVRNAEELPTVYIDAAGFRGWEWEGYEEALLSLLPFIKRQERKRKSINILGLDPFAPKAGADARELTRLLKECGYEVNAMLALHTSMEEIREMGSAEKNVVLGGYGLRLAEAMESELGIPYEVTDFPYGSYLTEKFLKQVTGSEYVEDIMTSLRRSYLILHRLYDLPVALVGDYGRVTALKKFFSTELGFDVRFTAIISGSPIHPQQDENLLTINSTIRAMKDELKLILGTSFQKRAAGELDLPLIRISSPVYDEVFLYDNCPYMGYRGAIVLVEKIINSFLNSYLKERW